LENIFLEIVDYFSKWFDLVELKYKNAAEVINKTKTIFSNNRIHKNCIAGNTI